jgi:hypothetical protein
MNIFIGIEYVFHENAISDSLLRRYKKDLYNCDNFEWYEDELELKAKLAKKFEIPVLSTAERFYGMYIEENVVNLKEKVLYLPIFHNCAVYDMMYVDREKKEITMFQITKKKGTNHVFKMETIDRVFDKMCVKEEKYTVNLVLVNDWNQINATGFYYYYYYYYYYYFLFIYLCWQILN